MFKRNKPPVTQNSQNGKKIRGNQVLNKKQNVTSPKVEKKRGNFFNLVDEIKDINHEIISVDEKINQEKSAVVKQFIQNFDNLYEEPSEIVPSEMEPISQQDSSKQHQIVGSTGVEDTPFVSAERFLEKIKKTGEKPEKQFFELVIKSYIQAESMRDAMIIFEEMKLQGYTGSVNVYSEIIEGFYKTLDIVGAEFFSNEMKDVYPNSTPPSFHLKTKLF